MQNTLLVFTAFYSGSTAPSLGPSSDPLAGGSDLGSHRHFRISNALSLIRKEMPSQSEPMTNRPSSLQERKPNPVEASSDSRP